MENSQPPNGGPIILPSESKEDNKPVVLPCPDVEVFVNKAETHGRMTPFPIPNTVRKIAAVAKLSTSRGTTPSRRSGRGPDRGHAVRAFADESIAAAALASGTRVLSRSLKYHRPRTFFCLEGHCSGCLVRLGGVPNLRACQAPCTRGRRGRGPERVPVGRGRSARRGRLPVLARHGSPHADDRLVGAQQAREQGRAPALRPRQAAGSRRDRAARGRSASTSTSA